MKQGRYRWFEPQEPSTTSHLHPLSSRNRRYRGICIQNSPKVDEKAPFSTVSSFEFDESRLPDLNVLHFEDATVDWLKFVGDNRFGRVKSDDWDIAIGPVANDATMPVLSLFFAEVYTEEETIRRLLPQKLKDQYAFKTQRAIDLLRFHEVVKA
nr:DUF3990 domain-containing protein [Adlercreutzia sp. ZJ473]